MIAQGRRRGRGISASDVHNSLVKVEVGRGGRAGQWGTVLLVVGLLMLLLELLHVVTVCGHWGSSFDIMR